MWIGSWGKGQYLRRSWCPHQPDGDLAAGHFCSFTVCTPQFLSFLQEEEKLGPEDEESLSFVGSWFSHTGAQELKNTLESCKLAVVLNDWVGDRFVSWFIKQELIHSSGLQTHAAKPVLSMFFYYFVKKWHVLFIFIFCLWICLYSYSWIFSFVVQNRNECLDKGDSQPQNKTLVVLHFSS